MQRFARVIDGAVVEPPVEIPDDMVIGVDIIHPDIAAQMVLCGPEVGDGWSYQDGAFSPPSSAPPSKAELIAYAADRRWLAEQAGTTWSGFPIHTDDRSQGKYLSELQAISLGVRQENLGWKFADGVFRPVSNADFPQLAIAARQHVLTVFGIEEAVLAEIEVGTITMPPQIEAAFGVPD